MSEEMIIRHCSPTLAGLKTANMFNCEYESEEELTQYLRNINTRLSRKGVRAIPLSCADNRALIYLFRPDDLEKDLSDERAVKILASAGYAACGAGKEPGKRKDCCCNAGCKGVSSCLMHLVGRLKETRTGMGFPHEIGLFLGYPPEDVKGFIEGDTANCTCVGTWKVFGDEKSARRTFAKYRKCSEVYSRLYGQGRPLEQLTVKSSESSARS